MPRAEWKQATALWSWLEKKGRPWKVLLVALVTCAGVASWSARAEPMTVSRSSTSVTGPGQIAHELFQRRCARCHDEEGTGRGVRDTAPQIPDFRSHAWQRQRSDTELRVAILEGKGTRMPSFAGRINEQEARELVGRIRAFDPTAARRLAESSTDFDRRFRELQLELEDLKKQFREMNQESRKP